MVGRKVLLLFLLTLQTILLHGLFFNEPLDSLLLN